MHQSYQRYQGDHSYRELVEKLIDEQGFVRRWDDRAKAPFLWNAEANTFITYDDPESIRVKSRYARDQRLGGIMFWELSQDRDDELLDAIVTSLE